MELNKIEALLAKYEEGNTSLAEEKQLQEFFTTREVPPHLWEYRMIFGYTKKERTAIYTNDIKVSSPRRILAFVGIAASIILAIGAFTSLEMGQQQDLSQQNLGTIEDPEEAYLKTKETLQMVAQVLNNGTEELIYVEEFNNTTNKYIKK